MSGSIDPTLEAWLTNFGLNQHKQQFVAEFISENKLNIGLFCFFFLLAIRQVFSNVSKGRKAGATREWLDAPNFPEIERLEDFDWKSEEPLKLRQFKPKYYLTMAIQNLNPSELLTMDRTYADRIAYRKRIMQESGDICLLVHDDERVRPAVQELYSYLLAHYLPKRYPTIFKLHYHQFDTGDQFMCQNLVTGQLFPTVPNAATPTRILLQTLGSMVDEDFLFLLPEETPVDASKPKYRLQALVTIAPSGWDPRSKIGKSLASIHTPVPGYKAKLEASMDRFFAGIEVGKYVKRSNWTITEHDELFMPDSDTNHGTEGHVEPVVTEIDPDKYHLRQERQTLHRLPTSRAVIFAFKTYMTTLRDIKLEGLGDDLADAIDGLKTGMCRRWMCIREGRFGAGPWGGI